MLLDFIEASEEENVAASALDGLQNFIKVQHKKQTKNKQKTNKQKQNKTKQKHGKKNTEKKHEKKNSENVHSGKQNTKQEKHVHPFF